MRLNVFKYDVQPKATKKQYSVDVDIPKPQLATTSKQVTIYCGSEYKKKLIETRKNLEIKFGGFQC